MKLLDVVNSTVGGQTCVFLSHERAVSEGIVSHNTMVANLTKRWPAFSVLGGPLRLLKIDCTYQQFLKLD